MAGRIAKTARNVAADAVAHAVAALPFLERPFRAVGPHVRHRPLVEAFHRRTRMTLADLWKRQGTRFRPVIVGGVTIKMDVTDFTCHGLYFHGVTYEPATVQCLVDRLRPGQTFVDVGANHGYFSVLAARLVGPAGPGVRVRAEPVGLRAALGTRRVQRPVQCRDRARGARRAGGTARAVRVCLRGKQRTLVHRARLASFASGSLDRDRHVQVHATTFDRWRRSRGVERIDLLKIDVEGAEMLVLRGMADTLAEAAPAGIICESHGVGGAHEDEARRLLVAHGYDASDLDVGEANRTALIHETLHAIMNRVRAVFVNSGMLGHASVASLIADAIARDPGIDATHISLAEPNGRGERLVRAAMCARPLGRTNLDLARWRSEMHSGLVASRRLRRVMASGTGQVDVLHFHTQATAYGSLGLMATTPSIVSIDITQPLASLEVPKALRVTYGPNVAHDGAVFRRARAIVATSRWAADSLQRVYPECAGKLTVLPYPVRLEKADREWIELRRRRAEDGPVRFLFMGGDFMRKGGPDLLRAWQEGAFAPPHRLTLVTDWPVDDHRLPPGVEIVRGVKTYTQTWRDLWRDADVFVMPARAEAFGMVFQEAAAAGLPAIGPRINAVPENR